DPGQGPVAFRRIGVVLVGRSLVPRRLREEAAQVPAAWTYAYFCAVLRQPQADRRSRAAPATGSKASCCEYCRTQQPMQGSPPKQKIAQLVANARRERRLPRRRHTVNVVATEHLARSGI